MASDLLPNSRITGQPFPVILVGENSSVFDPVRFDLRHSLGNSFVDEVVSLADARSRLRRVTAPTLLVVDVEHNSREALQVADRLHQENPNLHVVASATGQGNGLLLRSLQAGAEDYVPQPLHWTNLEATLNRLEERVKQTVTPTVEHRGHVVGVLAVEGGVGTTSLLVNLGVALAGKWPRSVCLIDLVAEFGSVPAFLDVEPCFDVLDVVRQGTRLDWATVAGSATLHPYGVRILAAPGRADAWDRTPPESVQLMIETTAGNSDVVLIDFPKRVGDLEAGALRTLDRLLLVVRPDETSARRAAGMLDVLERAGLERSSVRIVLAPKGPGHPVDRKEIESVLRQRVLGILPDDPATASKAINEGRSVFEVKPRSALARSYREIMGRLIDDLEERTTEPPQSLQQASWQTIVPRLDGKKDPRESWLDRIHRRMRALSTRIIDGAGHPRPRET